MARHSEPGLDVPRRKARTKRTQNITRTVFIEADDPGLSTAEGNAKEFIDQGTRRFASAGEAEFQDRIEGLLDDLMVDGEGQWDPDIKGKRMRKKRPCLTINRFVPMIAHVANEQRMSRPAIQIDPVGGGADKDSALIRQGIIRHIEIMSGAETTYDNAFERMITRGWSYFRVGTDYETPTSWRQVIKIKDIPNDYSVYIDPTAEEPTRKDMKWGFVCHDVPRGEYVKDFPKSKVASLTNFTSVGDQAEGWITGETIRVAEYYYVDDEPVDVVRLQDGTGIYRDEIEERAGFWWVKKELDAWDRDEINAEDLSGELPVVLDENGNLITRPGSRQVVKWAKINAMEILEGDQGDDIEKNTAGRVIAGKYIPLIRVSGRERVINGRRRVYGMVRNNRDAQRMYNYAISAFVEMIALAPKSPFIAVMSQIEKYKKIWDTANEENWPYLPYDAKTEMGQLLPPPQRTEFNPQVGALIQAIREFDNDLKIGFNIFDPSLGSPKSDQSGRAVAALQQRSDSANMNWLDNMRRSLIYCGEIILEMIPVIYDAPRIITIVHPDDKRQEVQINQEFAMDGGKLVNHDMAKGKFSVTVSLGEYASKRQRAVESLSQIAQNVPEVALPLLPLILENMDSPMSTEAAEIVQRMLPANLQKPGSPAQMQKQMQMFMQQHEMLVDALEKANETIKTNELDNETKKEVELIRQRGAIAIAAAKLGSAEGIAKLNVEYKRLGDQLARVHESIQGSLTRQHEKDMQAAEPEPVGA